MAAINRTQIKTDLAQLRSERALLRRLEAARDKELEPLEEAFEKKTAPINDKHSKKIDPVNDRISTLEKRIETELRKAIDADGDKAAVREVKGDGLIAELCSQDGQREVDPEKFFKFVSAKQRGSALFWKCLKVLIKPAEELLGKDQLSELAKPKKQWSVSIKESE